MIKIDGSYGEGGGQILRSSVALSVITGRAVEIRNIRAKRNPPGLRAQHIAAIKVLGELSDAEIHNLEVGSSLIRFIPGEIRKKKVTLDIGTAGSITMVLQAAIPAVSLSGVDAEVELIGGTDVRWSPTLDYVRYVLRDAYKLVGIRFDIEVFRRGYYPKGGGRVKCIIRKADLRAVELLSTPRPDPRVVSVCSMLPKHVAKRQADAALAVLKKAGIKCDSCSISFEDSLSPGSSILVYSTASCGPFIGGDAIGERGKPAEVVGSEAARDFLNPYKKGASVDKHLADMLVLPLAFSGSESRFTVDEVTKHLETNLYVIKTILGCDYGIESYGQNFLVTLLSA